MKKKITTYYNKLAKEYDKDRFSNSYGRYIHAQENKVLAKYLDENKIDRNLDLACGTGRFLHYANYGIDISTEMVKVANKKFPSKTIQEGDAESLPFENNSLANVLSFHLFMHLEIEQIKKILVEVNRVLSKDGYFIFDIPSKKRRQLTRYKANNWHGGNQIDLKTITKITNKNWEIESFHGIAFFPIHHIPKKWRPLFINLDNLMCRSLFKEFSSHLIFILRKK